jgi:hypothetical protein
MLLLGLAKQTDADSDAYASTYSKREYHIYHSRVRIKSSTPPRAISNWQRLATVPSESGVH